METDPSQPRTLPLTDEAATRTLAARLAALAGPGDVIALEGDLGAGKTALARAFVQALAGPEEEVPSPTFTLVQVYETPVGTVWHFDLYRLRRPDEALELGIEEALAEGIVLIEWPERLGPWLPPDRLTVRLEAGPTPTARLARLSGGRSWAERLQESFGG